MSKYDASTTGILHLCHIKMKGKPLNRLKYTRMPLYNTRRVMNSEMCIKPFQDRRPYTVSVQCNQLKVARQGSPCGQNCARIFFFNFEPRLQYFSRETMDSD